MEQKQRNRIAWVLAIILLPVLIYLVVNNIFNARKRPAVQPVARDAAVAPGLAPVGVPALPPLPAPAAPEPEMKPQIAAEQQQIATRLPRRNPFSASPQSSVAPAASPVSVASPDRSAEQAIRLTGIIARSGSKRLAMINGQMLGEGDRVGAWTIIKVNPMNVLLGNGAQQMVVGVR